MSYRQRLGQLIATHFDRLGIESALTAYEFGVSQIALSHGLALQRAANGSLRPIASDAVDKAVVRVSGRRCAGQLSRAWNTAVVARRAKRHRPSLPRLITSS